MDSVTEQNLADNIARERIGKTTIVFSPAPAWNAVADARLTARRLRETAEGLLVGAEG